MNLYLTLTTCWGTSASLLGASTPSEQGNDGALTLGAIAAVLLVLGVASRVLERGVEARQNRPNVETRRKGARRRQGEARRRAGRRVAFWTLVASGFASAAFLSTPDGSQKKERAADSTVAEQTREDAERSWDAPNVKIRAVADSEGSRWKSASVFQDVESEWTNATGNVARETTLDENKAVDKNRKDAKNSEDKASTPNAADAKRAVPTCRAVAETVVEAPSGELKSVEQIRAESSLEVAPAAPTASAASAYSNAERGVATENVAWLNRRVDAGTQSGRGAQFAEPSQNAATTQSGQVSQFARSSQNAATAQSGRIPQFAQPEQNLATAQSGQVSQFARSSQNAATAQSGRIPQFAQPAQNLAAAQSGQAASFARPAQNLAASRGAVAPSVYDERRSKPTQSELIRAFTPENPILPFPEEERVPEIASVSYEARSAADAPSLLEQIDAESERVGERVRKSVLSIETTKRAKTKSTKTAVETGCGFLFQYNDKIYLATNTHVVKDATTNKNVKLFLPDRSAIHPKKTMTCAEFDLAALELDPATLPTDGSVALCRFGDSDELRVSNFVGTIGNPFGLRDTVTYGHVSSLQRRKNDFTTDGEQSLLEFIQIDASINPGNSGGPLYNARGEVVGVVAAIATTSGKSEGVAFAIPINLALNVLKATIDAGGWSRSRMGVELETASRADLQGGVDRPIKSGAKIVSVGANSPAERAGLRPGDVVVEFDGEAIEDDVHFARLIAIADVSRDANVKFLRGAQLLETSARLERSDVK